MLVQRGTKHAWRNPSGGLWARGVFVVLDAEKVVVGGRELGAGRGGGGAGSGWLGGEKKVWVLVTGWIEMFMDETGVNVNADASLR